MSLYNTVFGFNSRAEALLAVLGLSPSDIPRFRDCYLRDHAIVIYTRTGGGNRDYYDNPKRRRECYPEYDDNEGPYNADLRKHPNYVTDVDCDFDCTYAYFFFSYPDEYKEELTALAQHEQSPSAGEKWRALFNEMEKTKK